MLILSNTHYIHYSFYALIIFVYSIKVIKKAPIESEPLSIIPKTIILKYQFVLRIHSYRRSLALL